MMMMMMAIMLLLMVVFEVVTAEQKRKRAQERERDRHTGRITTTTIQRRWKHNPSEEGTTQWRDMNINLP
uniref:Putative secreted protein n=1 Tax=Anopheles darlingi TaxID=43151 RepID=A0A2M4DM20_ANODA